MNIHESAEDYLEKILMLQEQKGFCALHRHSRCDGILQAECQCGDEKSA